MKPCILTDRDGLPNWCERHGVRHAGGDLALSQALTQEGAHFRWKLDRLKVRKKIHLRDSHCPGDFMVLTAALEAVSFWFPHLYTFKVSCKHPEIFAHNPHCSDFPDDQADQTIDMHYDNLAQSGWRDARFIAGYVEHLADKLRVPLKPATTHPHIYLSDEEQSRPRLIPERYALINSGYKRDGPLKNWGFDNWQKVADHILKRGLKLIQVGAAGDVHRRLSGAMDLVGKTGIRDLFLLAYHADFGLGHESFLHHVFAAFEKPFVCVAPGIYMRTWTNYVTEQYVTRQGTMDCCKKQGCGKNAGHFAGKGACEYPDQVGQEKVAGCLARIPPAEVIAAIEQWYEPGGILEPREVPELGFFARLGKFAGAAVKHAAGGFKHVTQEQAAARLRVCDGCEYKSGNACKICTCNLPWKATWASEDCPKGKWPK